MLQKYKKILKDKNKRNKYLHDKYIQIKRFFIAKLRITLPYRYTKAFVKQFWKPTLLFTIDGVAMCFTVTQLIRFFISPASTVLNVIAFGLALYIPKQIISKAFDYYADYKLRLAGYNRPIILKEPEPKMVIAK